MIRPWHLFPGRWELLPGSCVYEQGDPPRAGTYTISENGNDLIFDMEWQDGDGERHEARFTGRPNGVKMPLPGNDLANGLMTELVSETELTTTAFRGEMAVMFARRALSASRNQMTVSQSVILPDGTRPTNWSTYQRADS